MRKLLQFVTLLLSTLTFAYANTAKTPVGMWRSIDDVSGKPRSIISININNNSELEAHVVKILKIPGDTGIKNCVKCSGDLKDKPIAGMKILWGMTNDRDVWSGGRILDPKSGNIYRCKITPIENGKKLDVRGYIGFSLFGRSQTWERIVETNSG